MGEDEHLSISSSLILYFIQKQLCTSNHLNGVEKSAKWRSNGQSLIHPSITAERDGINTCLLDISLHTMVMLSSHVHVNNVTVKCMDIALRPL